VQAAINTYRARLAIEAPEVGRAYDNLVRETKDVAGPLITEGWQQPPLNSDSLVPAPDLDISSLDTVDKTFTDAVADHLSILWTPLRKRVRRGH
jgi:hypothetical protein